MSEAADNHIPRLHTVVEPGADRYMVTLTGELDLLTGPALLQMLDTVTGHVQHLSLDVAQLSFCDVAGLRALLKAQRAAHERGIGVTVCNTPTHFLWLLRVTGTAGQLLGDSFTGDTAAGDIGDHVPGTPSVTGTALSSPSSLAADLGTAEPDNERERHADERERRADDRELLDQERARLLNERAQRVREHQRWEDIREDLANTREQDLDQRDAAGVEPPRRHGQRES